jgi:mRNA interferase MazF
MNKTIGKEPQIKRGDVFWVNFDPTTGTETRKTRPAVVLSNNLFNKHLPRLLVAPVTSNVDKLFEFDALVYISQKKGKVMLDQMRAIDKGRLGDKICTLLPEEIINIDFALKKALALN